MTLNGVTTLILHFLPNSIPLQSDYITVDNVRKILSAPVFHFWPKLTTLQRGLSAIAELLVFDIMSYSVGSSCMTFTSF